MCNYAITGGGREGGREGEKPRQAESEDRKREETMKTVILTNN